MPSDDKRSVDRRAWHCFDDSNRTTRGRKPEIWSTEIKGSNVVQKVCIEALQGFL